MIYLPIVGAMKNVFFMTSWRRYSIIYSQDVLIDLVLTGPRGYLYDITQRNHSFRMIGELIVTDECLFRASFTTKERFTCAPVML